MRERCLRAGAFHAESFPIFEQLDTALGNRFSAIVPDG